MRQSLGKNWLKERQRKALEAVEFPPFKIEARIKAFSLDPFMKTFPMSAREHLKKLENKQ